MRLEHKAKIYGVIGTILVHSALFLFLWFWVFPQVLPNDEQFVVFGGGGGGGGTDGDGGGNEFFEPVSAREIESLPEFSEIIATSTGGDEFLVQDIEESVTLPSVKKESNADKIACEQEQKLQKQKELERKEEQRKAAEAKALKDAQDKKAEEIKNSTKNLFNPNTPSGQGTGQSGTGGSGGGTGGGSGTGTGTGTGSGSGSGDGSGTGSGSGSGTGAGTGSYSLAERTLVGELVKPTYNVYEEGKVVVTIIVNKDGAVINATVGSGTNTDNQTLRNAAVEAAQKTKFNKITTDKNQSGTITYIFKLQ